MERRSFLKSIIAAVAMAPGVARLAEWTEPETKAKMYVVNPEWVTAPYEYASIPVWPTDDYARRFYFDNGKYVEVPAFIEA